MAGTQHAASGVADVMEGIVDDLRKLIEQEFRLLRSEFQGEVRKARGAAVSLAAGAGLAAAGGMLSTVMLVELLHDLTRLPRWACYGLVAGGLGAAGVKLLASGAARAAELDLVPHRTLEAVKETAGAVRDRATAR